MERILAIKSHDGLCWKCLQSFDESNIHIINIPEMGYGSQFDGESTEIHLCHECYKDSTKEIPDLWSMETKQCDFDTEDNYGFYEYKNEKKMLDYIHKLTIQGRQFVENEFSSDGWRMEAQDWIDYQLDMLPHDKCKEYMMYSPEEIKAYEERFSSCEYPVNRIWDDGSKGCSCPFGASGEYGQQTSVNISGECYQCSYYVKRFTPIKDIEADDFGEHMEHLRHKIRAKELEEKFRK